MSMQAALAPHCFAVGSRAWEVGQIRGSRCLSKWGLGGPMMEQPVTLEFPAAGSQSRAHSSIYRSGCQEG